MECLADRPPHVRPDRRRLRRSRSAPGCHPSISTPGPLGSRDDKRRPHRPRRHRQGLRGRPDGGTARGVGARPGARPRRVQLGPSRSTLRRARRVAAHAERSAGSPPAVLARLAVRQTALGASGRRKGDHIVDPRTGEPARGRRAAWVAVPRRKTPDSEVRTDGSPRIAPATVADALTTAFLLLVPTTSRRCASGVRASRRGSSSDPTRAAAARPRLLHFGGSRPGYTSASSESAT